jgi:two-component system, LytTR family, sensor kinase
MLSPSEISSGSFSNRMQPMLPLQRLKTNREALFWVLHALGWSAYGIAQYLGSLLYWNPKTIALLVVIAAAAGFVLSIPLRYLCRALYGRRLIVVAATAVPVTWILAMAWRATINTSYSVWGEPDMAVITHWADRFIGTVSAMYLLVCWMGLYFAFHYYESMQSQRQAALRAAALAQEAQFKMLRYQLNPHFLFNTLNAISTLILDSRNQTANSAVTGLSDFLRYTLDQDPMKKVTVAQELEALQLYLNIEKLRFGERLIINMNIADSVKGALVPSLLLQPLIENCIKYAIAPRESGGSVRVSGVMRDATVVLEVADDGPGMSESTRSLSGRGVGLRNTRERLSVLYGERASVEVRDAGPGLLVALNFPAEFTGP